MAVTAVPEVSVVTVVSGHPSFDVTDDCIGSTVHLTTTSPMYQPAAPWTPSTCRVIAGGAAEARHVSGNDAPGALPEQPDSQTGPAMDAASAASTTRFRLRLRAPRASRASTA